MKAPVSPPETPRPEVDLDATAELPVLDPAEMEPEGEANEAANAAHSTTDTWILPPGAAVAPIHLSDATVELPLPVGGALSAPRGGTAGGAELREPEANLQTTIAKLRDAERRAESLRAELTRHEAAAVRHRSELETATRVRSLAEQHAASVEDELLRAREMSSTLSEQVTQLQQRLAQHQIVVSGEVAREREQQQALTVQTQAHSARLIQDLHLERARSASCLEALQTLEIRRQIAESVAIDLQREMETWHSTEAELRGRLERQLSSLEARMAQQSASEAQREEELQRLRTQRAELDVMLAAERDATVAAMTETAAREAALASERARNTQLEEALTVERQRVTELEGQVATMSGEMGTSGGALKNAHQERNAQLDDTRGTRIEALQRANEHWRTTTAVGRGPSHEETTHGDVLHPEQTADGMARLLIHSDEGREVVHVLGRKTSIGRTPDNDVQIDGRHISRHHAVILAGPATTLIEDLNSTNGVMVNGRRVVRQVLKDGDQVTIGRTMYRFAVRRANEPR